MAKSEVIEFNGTRFRRYPDSKRRSDRVYFSPGIGDRQRGIKRLHEEIWKAAHGPIPEGHHIHHVDEDPLNNELSNLEAKPGRLHLSDHHAGICTPAMRENLDRIRPKASAWHASPEGIAWHREHAKTSLRTVEPIAYTCEQCSRPFEAIPNGLVRFCSNACKSAWRRASGVDNEERVCTMCSAPFTVNRYAKKRTCSSVCAGRAISQTRLANSTSP